MHSMHAAQLKSECPSQLAQQQRQKYANQVCVQSGTLRLHAKSEFIHILGL